MHVADVELHHMGAIMPLRITIVTGPFLPIPPGPAGAVEKIWYSLALEFASRGHAVTVVSRSADGQAREATSKGVHHLTVRGFSRTGRISLDLAKDLAYSAGVLPKIPRADIIVSNTFWLPVFAGRMQRSSGKLVVSVERFPKGQIRLYGRAARLCAPSTAVRDAVLAECPSSAREVITIGNPIDTNIFVPLAESRSSRTPKTILYTGRIHPEKGLGLLIAAFSRLAPRVPDLRLRIIGPSRTDQGGGGEAYLRALKATAAGLPVEFVDPIFEPSELASALQRADYYCYPSLADRGESFGVAPLEAMATGLVPIVSDLACFRDFIQHDSTGLIFNHRAADPAVGICECLMRLIETPGLNKRLSDAAVAKAGEFSQAVIATRFLSEFSMLVNGPK
jgi:glycosyltransferase involved in cell wall biosynthesis